MFMNLPLLRLVLVGSVLSFVSLQSAPADNTAAPASAPAATAPAAGGQGDHAAKFQAALAELDLSDDQKTKIQGIMSSMPAGRERRRAIAAVLTPDQKAKLKELIKAHREGSNT
jgi:Spy/CpxP family protein refolding chaperone